MTCPKCGAASEEGRVECSACGIIFARWRPAEPKLLRAEPKQLPVEPRGSSTAIEWRNPLVISIAVVLVLCGLMWAANRSYDPVAPAPPKVSTSAVASPAAHDRSGAPTAQSPTEDE